jgi:hypothetical protein
VLVGEFGIAAVSALLDIPVCQVEGSSIDYLEFARFFKKFFSRARKNNCEIVFPTDFAVAAKINRTDCVTDTARAKTDNGQDEPLKVSETKPAKDKKAGKDSAMSAADNESRPATVTSTQ